MKNAFVTSEKPLKTVMIQVRTCDEALRAAESGLKQNADAFGLQLENMLQSERTEANLRRIFAFAEDKPFYVTNYKCDQSENTDDDERMAQLLLAADCGAALIDIPGDTFCADPDQLTYDCEAVRKQTALIEKIHFRGAKALISSHVPGFRTGDYVTGMAFEQKRRGADISKIVTFSNDDIQLAENLKTTVLLKETLGIPFLFLSGGEKNRLHRLAGPFLGCCMYLCVAYRAPITTLYQPLIDEITQFEKIIYSRK